MKRYFLGVDYGGSSVKATLLDAAGSTLATAVVEYTTYYPRERWAEQNPEELYAAFCRVVRKLLDQSVLASDEIESLAISAGSQSGVYLDEHDKHVRNIIYWADMRAVDYAMRFKREKLDYFFATTKNQPTASRTINHIMWIRDNEPENYRRIRRIMFTKDYIRYRLTGDFVTDYIDAMGSHLMDVPNSCWSETLCGFAGIATDMLPEILSPMDSVGSICAAAAKETGLSMNTRVIVGSTDTVMETYANGAVHEGDTIIKVSTAGRIITVTREPVLDMGIVNYRHVVPGFWYPGTGRGGCATSYRWFRDVLGDKETADAKALGLDPYVLLDRQADSVPAGSDGLMFMPYLTGSNAEPSRCASFVGLRSDHTKAHFSRSVLEGVGYAIKEDMETMHRLNLAVNSPILIGGAAKGRVWPQIMADMLNMELGLAENSDSSLGSAMLAGVAAGAFESFDDSVHRCVRRTGSIRPKSENVEIYERGFRMHERFIDVMDDVYRETNGK